VSGVGPTAILPLIDPKLPYNPSRDLEIVAGLSAVDFILVARPSLPVANLKELISYARANPGKVTYGSAGVAGPQQLMVEHLAMLSGMRLFHVPYPGDAPAIAAVVSGEVDIALAGAASSFGLIRSGKLNPLAASSRRSAELPDLATVAEQSGFEEFAGYTWNILVAPKGTPAAIISQLNRAVNEIAAKPAVQQRLEGLGLRPLPGDIAMITKVIDNEVAKYRRIIEVTGLRRE
jgi:tripartite-type tricarboxylate transporter receptor subunit TctC